ncbi:sugar phosphate isomerase/epimerase family protein [Paenibacillus glacialis]|uniref:Xylose isomerase-like TIM barrel domain-containing protein n=1 Tax=Paenibacillus glacialis TaxID=494026 RepID=A0A168D0X1_9BACL|nr:sugar phosphate isomerase/epimerase family protein [Paenibacillus glacialis]OAB33780.1 hypothetical protein PGLA_22885 [Paenibacillus glacialis]
MTWKYSISTGCWYAAPVEEIITRISYAGYDALSVGAKNEQQVTKNEWRLLRKIGLAVESVHAPKIDLSSTHDDERRKAIELTIQSIIFAHELECPFVVVHPFERMWKNDMELHERTSNTLRSLAFLIPIADKYAVKLALENLDYPKDTFLKHIYQEALGMGVVMCYDSGHALIQSDPLVWWDKIAPYIKVLHLNDNDGISDSHDSVGSGYFPWDALASRLKIGGYDGYIGLECKFRGSSLVELSQWLEHNITRMKQLLEGGEKN